MKLKGKVAIVTGAAQGIGRSIALELASAGACVVVSDIQDKKISDVAQEIRNIGQQSLHIVADVTVIEQVEQMVKGAIAEFGRVDILVNNAGGSGNIAIKDIEEVPEHIWIDQLSLNLSATFLCSQAVEATQFHRLSVCLGCNEARCSTCEGPRSPPWKNRAVAIDRDYF